MSTKLEQLEVEKKSNLLWVVFSPQSEYGVFALYRTIDKYDGSKIFFKEDPVSYYLCHQEKILDEIKKIKLRLSIERTIYVGISTGGSAALLFGSNDPDCISIVSFVPTLVLEEEGTVSEKLISKNYSNQTLVIGNNIINSINNNKNAAVYIFLSAWSVRDGAQIINAQQLSNSKLKYFFLKCDHNIARFLKQCDQLDVILDSAIRVDNYCLPEDILASNETCDLCASSFIKMKEYLRGNIIKHNKKIPNDVAFSEFYQLLSVFSFALGQNKEGLEYGLIAEQFPGSSFSLNTHLIDVFIDNNCSEHAIELALRSVCLNKRDAFAWYKLAESYVSGKLYLKSVDCFEKAIQLAPESIDFRLRISGIFYDLQEYKKSIIHMDVAFDLGVREIEFLLWRSRTKALVKDYLGAKNSACEAELLFPTNAELIIHIGNLYFMLREWESSLKYYNKSYSIDDPDILLHQSICLAELGRYSEAIIFGERAVLLGGGGSQYQDHINNIRLIIS